MKKRLVTGLVVSLCCVMGWAAAPMTVQETLDAALANEAAEPDDIMLSNIPIAYGDESFRQRIAARTEGKRDPIGLVLSGGSARAMAHIGVLRYLEEHGIVPDFIVSNSMGSIVAMLYSAGMSPDEIEQMITQIPMGKAVDLTLPINGGFLETQTLGALMEKVLGKDTRIEDLEIPLLVVQEDLVTKRQILVAEGDFDTIFRSSFAIPVYFSPEYYNGHLLIDGGVTNLAPIDVAYRYTDKVIVSTTFQTVDTLNLRNPLTDLNVMLDISKRRNGVNEMEAHPDLIWIRCQVEQTSFMDFGAIHDIAEKGYEAAQAQGDALAALEAGDGAEGFTEKRDQLSRSIDRSLDDFYLYYHVSQPKFSNLVGLEFHSFFADPLSTLKDSEAWGVAYRARWKDFQLIAQGGINFRTMTNDDFGASPAAMLRLDYYLLDHVRFGLLGDLDWDRDSWKSTRYGRQSVESRWRFFDGGSLDLRAFEVFEALSTDREEHFDGTTLLLTMGAVGSYVPDGGRWDAFGGSSAALAFRWFGNDDTFRPFLELEANLRDDKLPGDFFFHADNTLRIALDGEENVPLFSRDGFRTSDVETLAHGHDPDRKGHGGAVVYTGRLTAGWRPSAFKPSMAELLILNGTSVAAYFDMLATGNDFEISVGMEWKTSPSLLGMKDLPLTAYVGYDSAADGVVWGVYLSSVLE